MTNVKEFAEKHLNQEVRPFEHERWFIVGYNSAFDCITIGSFEDKTRFGWYPPMIYWENEVILYPDPIFIKHYYRLGLMSIEGLLG